MKMPMSSQSSAVRCRMCRTSLYGASQIVVDARRRCCPTADRVLSVSETGASYPDWVVGCLDQGGWQRGKLFCPVCRSKVGHFNFVGGRRCCADSLLPEVYLIASSVDLPVAPGADQQPQATSSKTHYARSPSCPELELEFRRTDMMSRRCISNERLSRADATQKQIIARRVQIHYDDQAVRTALLAAPYSLQPSENSVSWRTSTELSSKTLGTLRWCKNKMKYRKRDTMPRYHPTPESLACSDDVDDKLKCAVCLELYCFATKCLPCQHSFCLPCLKMVNKVAQKRRPETELDIVRRWLCNANAVACPLCRREIGCTVPDTPTRTACRKAHPELALERIHWYRRQKKFRRLPPPATHLVRAQLPFCSKSISMQWTQFLTLAKVGSYASVGLLFAVTARWVLPVLFRIYWYLMEIPAVVYSTNNSLSGVFFVDGLSSFQVRPNMETFAPLLLFVAISIVFLIFFIN